MFCEKCGAKMTQKICPNKPRFFEDHFNLNSKCQTCAIIIRIGCFKVERIMPGHPDKSKSYF
ncbi:hypothetical protein BpHYR1_049966 [Brachionus plicatilis]|uniref:Uncharacterized protein n=1 Tax=Brachionus plicatilis TaxID=10195 RepID=A0A3M7R4Z5_BRAPC|nr:hypothetical protein BpHYR1_049966 [Brachionus plicatilis]